MEEPVKFPLSEEEIPTSWVNLLADLPGDPPPPPLSPATGEPVGPEDLSAIFPMAIIAQEVSTDPDIAIPEEVRDVYRLWRPTPLLRARRLERLDTPAHIYYKYEGVSPAGSHKPNTAVAQAFYNSEAGIRKLATETGAGSGDRRLPSPRPALRARVRGVHGRDLLRPEALSEGDDRDLGRDAHRSPSGSDRGWPLTGRTSVRQPGDRDLRGRRGRRRIRGGEFSLGSVPTVCLHQTVIGQSASSRWSFAGRRRTW